ncbi:MAG TPA: DUF2336 domain-containing protein [Kiloniellales bacterium]|jgi:uncharacterized protein (DUF2336 family)
MATIKDTPPHLSQANVTRLRRDPTPRAKVETAIGVAAVFARGNLTDRERQYALDIIERLAHDVERQVRTALSEHVKHCPFLPTGIAMALARDVESVALPIIRYSEVFSDDDLLALIREGSAAKQVAIANRAHVTETVADALVDTRRKEVVGALLENRGAEIGENAFAKVIGEFTEDTDIHALLVDREMLPAKIVARLITSVSEALRQRLVERHDFPEALAGEMVMHGRDRAVSESVAPFTPQEEVAHLLEALRATHGLSPTFLLRSLTMGDLAFFESSLAVIARLPQDNIAQLIRDRGVRGFQSVYTRAGLPPQLYSAFRTALDVVLEVRATRPQGWSDEDTKRIVSGLVRAYDDICPENIENVLGRLARRAASPVANDSTAGLNRRWNDVPPAMPVQVSIRA